MQRIKTSPFVPNTDDVRRFVYEVESGKLREVVRLRPTGRLRSGIHVGLVACRAPPHFTAGGSQSAAGGVRYLYLVEQVGQE